MREKVATLCQTYLTDRQQTLLDIGCGEGYYTDFFAKALRQQDSEAQILGLIFPKSPYATRPNATQSASLP